MRGFFEKPKIFFGLANYCTCFVPNMLTLLEPLNSLLRHGEKFTWTKECENSFMEIKGKKTVCLNLAHYDQNET